MSAAARLAGPPERLCDRAGAAAGRHWRGRGPRCGNGSWLAAPGRARDARSRGLSVSAAAAAAARPRAGQRSALEVLQLPRRRSSARSAMASAGRSARARGTGRGTPARRAGDSRARRAPRAQPAPCPCARQAYRRTRGASRWPALPLAPEDEVKHFKLIGTTGTGKSTAIRELLGAALARGDRAVIADPDGGYLRRFYDARRGDVILNPFEAALGEVGPVRARSATDYDVEQLARSLIPDHEGVGSQLARLRAHLLQCGHLPGARGRQPRCARAVSPARGRRHAGTAGPWWPARRRSRSSKSTTAACSTRSAR